MSEKMFSFSAWNLAFSICLILFTLKINEIYDNWDDAYYFGRKTFLFY